MDFFRGFLPRSSSRSRRSILEVLGNRKVNSRVSPFHRIFLRSFTGAVLKSTVAGARNVMSSRGDSDLRLGLEPRSSVFRNTGLGSEADGRPGPISMRAMRRSWCDGTLDQAMVLRLCHFWIHRPIGCAVHLVPGEEQPVVQDGPAGKRQRRRAGEGDRMKVRLGLREACGTPTRLPGRAHKGDSVILAFPRKALRCVSA